MRFNHPQLGLLLLGFAASICGYLRAQDVPPEAGTNAAAWLKLGDALMRKSCETIDGSVYDRAKSAYHKALAKDPTSVEALTGLAWVYNNVYDFDEGLTWAEKALAANSKLPRAHALAGDAALELGDYDAARDHYQKALELQPDQSSYSRAAHLVWLTGNNRKAHWLMEKAIKAGAPEAEDTACCRAELALMLWNDGALVPAEQEAEAALKQAPTNAQVLATMGKIKTAKKEYDKAIDFYKRAVQVAPTHDSLVALGDLYALTNQREEAEARYKQVVELHTSGPPHSSPDAQLARFYADHDRRLDDALREAETAYRHYKTVAVADTLAWCYYKKGLYDPARKTIVKALHWRTPDANILFHAGMISAKSGDRAAAKGYLYQALNLNPRFDPLNASVAANTLKTLGDNSTPQVEGTREKE
jgi:tetratricopeptide (TPR) repeat protein